MRRVSVVGNSGSGKSTLARRIADHVGVPYHELDAIQHLPDWQPIDPDEFLAQAAAIATTEGWVVDGNDREVVVEGPIWERVDTVVWLDLPRRTVMRQVTWRTISRGVRRQELWNGNRGPERPGERADAARHGVTQSIEEARPERNRASRSATCCRGIRSGRWPVGPGPSTRSTAGATATRWPHPTTRTSASSVSAATPTRRAGWPR